MTHSQRAESSRNARRPGKKYDSCFGLAEQMLRAIGREEFEEKLGRGFEDDLVVSGIKIPVGDRGMEKVTSAAHLVMSAINQQLLEMEHPSIEGGLLKSSLYIHDDMVQLRLDPRFKPSSVHIGDAQEALREAKKIFEQKDEPGAFHTGSKKNDRFYWMGPFSYGGSVTVAAEIFDALIDFHKADLQINHENVDGQAYFKIAQPSMTQLLQKEGLMSRRR